MDGDVVDGNFEEVDLKLVAGYVTIKAASVHSHVPKTAVKENEVAGTCKAEGTYDEVVYCSECEEEISRTEKKSGFGGHTYEDKRCIHCGELEAVTGPAIFVNDAMVSAGETVNVNVEIKNNPDIFGAILKFTFDNRLTLTGATAGSAFNGLVMTKPGSFTSPCNFVWDGQDAPATEDGVILTLTFTVANDVTAGEKLEISCSYMDGDVVDGDFEEVDLELVAGYVTVAD